MILGFTDKMILTSLAFQCVWLSGENWLEAVGGELWASALSCTSQGKKRAIL